MQRVLIGEGSHGCVFDNNDGTVAKHMPIIGIIDDGDRQFLRADVICEPASLLRSKNCRVPYIANYLGCHADTKSKFNMIMDIEKLHRVPYNTNLWTDEWIRKIVAQLFTAVAGLHRVGIHHCDIKTENTMLDEDDNVRLIDFSLAHIDSTLVSRRWEELYTLNYRCPELLLGLKAFDREKADVWAAGITACEIMLGRLAKHCFVGGKCWRSVLWNAIRLFGIHSGACFYPIWPAFIANVNTEGIANNEAYDEILKVRGESAADFICCACNPDPRKRWSAALLLKHPYISELNMSEILCTISQPRTIRIVGLPNVHPIFWNKRNPERELIVDEFLKTIGLDSHDVKYYAAATHICSTFLLEPIVLDYFDPEAISEVMLMPGVDKFFATHLFTYHTDENCAH